MAGDPFPAASPRVLSDLWAGAATALIFYVEYLGLGAILGEALSPGSTDGAALGTLLVVVPVATCALFAPVSRGAILAGPRAASTVVAGKLLAVVAASQVGAQVDRAVLLAVMTSAAAATLLVGRVARIRRAIACMPPWLAQSFMVSTALGIISGSASAGRLLACQRLDAVQTWLAYLPAVILGVGWKPGFRFVRRSAVRRGCPDLLLRVLDALLPLGLFAGAALSWVLYAATSLPTYARGPCGRVGDLAMDWSSLVSRIHAISRDATSLPVEGLALAALCGVAIGAVLVLESLTAMAVDTADQNAAARQARMLAACSAGGVLAAIVGAAPPSFSTSRTVALRALGGHGWLAVLVHGIALVAIAMFGTSWLSRLPLLTAAVALTLVGLQMLGRDTEVLWERGYDPRADAHAQADVVRFWLVVGVSLAADNALAGFVAVLIARAACARVCQSLKFESGHFRRQRATHREQARLAARLVEPVDTIPRRCAHPDP